MHNSTSTRKIMSLSDSRKVRSKLTDTKVYMPIHYDKPNDVLKELQDIYNLTKTDAKEQIAQQQNQPSTQANLFAIENFVEFSDGGDDRIPSQSEQEQDHEEDSKDAGSTAVFQRLVAELNQAGSMQSVLAVSTINQSIDFSSAKFRQTFAAQSGITALMKMLCCMQTSPITAEERKTYIYQDLQRIDPKVGYEILLVFATLGEMSKDSRKTLLAEDVMRAIISLIKLQFSSSYPVQQQTLFKARCFRVLAALLLVSAARNYVRRINAIPIFVKTYRQALRDYQINKSEENATLLAAVASSFESLLKSQRCKQVMIKLKLVQTLVDSLVIIPIQAKVSEDLIIQCGQIKKNASLDDMLMEAVSNCLRLCSASQQGRNDILQANGIEKICSLLQNSKSTKVIQRSVAVLANCAQDSGVDQAVRKAKGLKVLANQLSSNDFQTLEAICKTIVSVCRAGPYFGNSETCLHSVHQINQNDKQQLKTAYLTFNKRNEENIIDLCAEDTINQLGRLINQNLDVLADTGLDKNALIVQRSDDNKITEASEARQLVILATDALIPLLSSKRGRQTFKSNLTLVNALLSHLSIGDVDVLISTLHALYVASEHDPDIAKQISFVDPKAKKLQLSESVKSIFTLLMHKNLQVVTAAAMCLNPICRDKNRAFMIGREIPTALIQTARLLRKKIRPDLSGMTQEEILQMSQTNGLSEQARKDLGEDQYYDFDSEDEYLPLLLEEQYGWLMGVVAELSRDPENAKVFSEYHILGHICLLCNQHSGVQQVQARRRAYDFYINQLIKEKSGLALSQLAQVPSNMSKVADMQTIPALVSCICTANGRPVFSSQANQLLGTQIQNCQHPFGSKVNFSLENTVKKLEERRQQQQEQERKNKTNQNSDKVDKDPQHTSNPYSIVNCAACRAMAALSESKTCALLLRQYGAVYGLLTLAGSEETETQEAAAQAIKNIRIHHLHALQLYKQRLACEKEFTDEEPKDGRISDRKVYDLYVHRAVESLYTDLDSEGDQLYISDTRHNSTLALIRRNETADRLAGQKEVELVGDALFNQRTEIVPEANAVTFNAVIGVLKHPQTEEPLDRQLDTDPIQKEAQCASMEWKKAQQIDIDEQAEQNLAELHKMKPVIKERPPRVAQPLGWKAGGLDNDRQASEIFKTLRKDKISLQDCQELLEALKLPDDFIGGLFKLQVGQTGENEIDEQQFCELYRQAQTAARTESTDKYDLLFSILDELQDGKVHCEEYARFAAALGVAAEIDQPIDKRDFKAVVSPDVYNTFYGIQKEQPEEQPQINYINTEELVQEAQQIVQDEPQQQEQQEQQEKQEQENNVDAIDALDKATDDVKKNAEQEQLSGINALDKVSQEKQEQND